MTPDRSSIESLLGHAAFARRLARVLVLDEARADDVVQQAWLNALEHPPHAGRGVRSWLATVVRNTASKLRREESRREAREQRAATPEQLPSTADVAAQIAAQRELLDAVARLDEPYRSTVHARFFEERTPTEIAAAQSIPVRTVETRLRRALAQLREELDRKFAGGREAWAGLLAPLGGLPLGGAIVATQSKVATIAVAAVLVIATGATLFVVTGSRRAAADAVADAGDAATASAATPRAGPIASSAPAGVEERAPPIVAERATTRCDVVVVTPEGEGIAGAALILFRGDELLATATTDASGRAALPIVESLSELLVFPGCAPRTRVAVVGGSKSIEVAIEAGALFAGRVSVDGHRPDAPLELTVNDDAIPRLRAAFSPAIWKAIGALPSSWNELRAATDADGAFTFRGLLPDRRFYVHLPVPYQDAATGEPGCAVAAARDDVELAVRVNPSILGRLVDRAGAPLSGWSVLGWSGSEYGASSQPTARSEADGSFRVDLHNKHGPATRFATLYVSDPTGLFVRRVDVRQSVDGGFDVGAVVIDVQRTLALDPRDGDGRPIDPFVAVVERAVVTDEADPFEPGQAMNGAHARAGFTLGEEIASVRVVAPGFATAATPPTPSREPVRVTMTRAAQLVVVVKDDEGRALDDGSLEVSASTWPAAWTRDDLVAAHQELGGSPLRHDDRAPATSFRVPRAKDGAFRLLALLPGLPLSLVVRDRLGAEALREEITLASGELRRLERTVASPVGAITGVVRARGGAPLPESNVRFRADEGGASLDAKVDAQGRFRIDGIRARRGTLEAGHESYSRHWVRDVVVGDGSELITIELAPGRALVCDFIGDHGDVEPAAVWIERADARAALDGSDEPPPPNARFAATRDRAGRYCFEELPDAKLVLRMSTEGFTFAYGVPGEDSTMGVAARLRGPVAIDWSVSERTAAGRELRALRLLPVAGFFLARATIAISPEDASQRSGVARIERVPADSYRVALVWVDATGALTEEVTEVRVEFGEEAAARVTLAR